MAPPVPPLTRSRALVAPRPNSPVARRRLSLPRADDAPALRWAALLLDLLDLSATGSELTGVTGSEEDREADHGVTEERGRDAARDGGRPAAGDPDEEGHDEHVAVANRSAAPRRERVEDRLDHVRRIRLETGDEERPKDRAPERDLVDQGRDHGVEQGAGVRPDVGEAQPAIAVERDAEHDCGSGCGVQEAVRDRERPVAGAEEHVDPRRRMDDQGPRHQDQAAPVPGDAPVTA